MIVNNKSNNQNKFSSFHNKLEIAKLFAEGKKKYIYPISACYIKSKDSITNSVNQNKILFHVPKKIFKKAVIRNKTKRRIKEAFRILLKQKLIFNKPIWLGLKFLGKETDNSYKIIYKSIEKILSDLSF